MLEDELLDVVNDDNRWEVTDNDLGRMTDKIKGLQRELEQSIENLLVEESELEETVM